MTNGQEPPPSPPPPPSTPRLPAQRAHAHLTPDLLYTYTKPQVSAVIPIHSFASPAAFFSTASLFNGRRCNPNSGREVEGLCNSQARPNARPRLCRVSSLAYLPGLYLPGSSSFHPFIPPTRLLHLPPAYIYLYHLLPPPRVPLIPPPASPSPALYRHSSPGNIPSLSSPHPFLCLYETYTNIHGQVFRWFLHQKIT